MQDPHDNRLIVCVVLCLIGSGCNKSFDPSGSSNSISRTLESLQQIDDHPVYTMTYYGDYGFSRYLKTGSVQPPVLPREGLLPADTWGCSCIAALSQGADKIFGRNFDWTNRATLVLFTDPPDGYASVSAVDLVFLGYSNNPDLNAISERGRLLGAPYYSLDGMNEKGVAIGMMAIPTARSPYDLSKITIGELQVIRLVLDFAMTVQEAVQLISRFNVALAQPPVHYLIADRTGNSAIVEFLNGTVQVIHNKVPWQVATNFNLSGSRAMTDFQQADCWRYKLLWSELDKTGGNITTELGMRLLQNVSQTFSNGGTMWSAVYNLSNGQMLFVPGRKYGSVKRFDLRMNP